MKKLSKQQMMQLAAQYMAAEIISSRRAQAPEGFDPKNANEISLNINATCTVAGTTTQGAKIISLNNASGDIYAATLSVSTDQQINPGFVVANCQSIFLLNLGAANVKVSYDAGAADVVCVLVPGVPTLFTPNTGGAYPYLTAASGTQQVQCICFGS